MTMRLLRKGKEMKREIDKKGEGRFKKAVKKIVSMSKLDVQIQEERWSDMGGQKM